MIRKHGTKYYTARECERLSEKFGFEVPYGTTDEGLKDLINKQLDLAFPKPKQPDYCNSFDYEEQEDK